MINYNTPYYIVYENKLRNNLDLITNVMSQTGANHYGIQGECSVAHVPYFQRIRHLLNGKFCERDATGY